MDGVLVVDKPAGSTSFDVVRRLRRATAARKVGHGGTLDPMATGVLPICFGEATKLAAFLLDADKSYQAELRLGVATVTGDAEGAESTRAPVPPLDQGVVAAALAGLVGPALQTPPRYSALKKDGRPLYSYARAGQEVERAARPVFIHALGLRAWQPPDRLVFEVRCSKGTYVRVLGEDIGRALGTVAHLTGLRRTRSGPFDLGAALSLARALELVEAGEALPLVAPVDALAHLPLVPVSAETVRALHRGQRVAWPPGLAPPATGAAARVVGPAGALVAVAQLAADGSIATRRVFGYGSAP